MTLGTDRLWPHWLARQVDPESPDFVPGPVATMANVTHRSWTLLGNVASPDRGVVDPRGLVTPGGAWSLDWWIGADDRWHLPSRDTAVRQHLIDGAPVVETAVRIPGGDAVQRVWAMRGSGSAPVAGFVIVEIENRSAVPFALALAVRPYHPLGLSSVGAVALVGTTVLVDGAPAVLLPKVPARVAVSDGVGGDVVHVVVAGLAGDDPTASVTCPDGRAQVAVLFPLPHTARLRVALPLGEAPPPTTVLGRVRDRGSGPAVEFPEPVPDAMTVAAGWAAQTRRGPRVELPDARLSDALAAARRALLLMHGGDDLAGWPAAPFDGTEVATVLGALDRFGLHAEAEQVLVGLPDRQGLDGRVASVDGRVDGAGAALHALGEHWRLTRDDELAETLVGPVAKAVHWIDKRRTSRRSRRGVDVDGLLPAGTEPGWAGPTGVYFRDAFWSLRGLRDAADLLARTGQPEVADAAGRFARELDTDLRAAMARCAERLGVAVLPAGPDRALDGGVVANLVAAGLDVLDPTDPVLVATLDYVRERFVTSAGVVHRAVDGAGLSPMLTLDLATAELLAGDPRALARLTAVLDLASPTWTWPTVVHPRSRGGSAGVGHDAATVAAFCTFVRRLLVREEPGGLAICSLVPPSWLGQGVEVHDAPTTLGRFSFAVRWHGERPAVLWELDAHPGVDAVAVRAPGLDPSWVGSGARGEALLAPVSPPGEPGLVTDTPPAVAGGGGSFA